MATKKTYYSVLLEELGLKEDFNVSMDDTPQDISRNLKKSVNDDLTALKNKKAVYDGEVEQTNKRIKTNVENALAAIEKITGSLAGDAQEPAPEEELPPQEPAPEETQQQPLMSKKVEAPAGSTESQKRLYNSGIKKDTVKMNDAPITKEQSMQARAMAAGSQMNIQQAQQAKR